MSWINVFSSGSAKEREVYEKAGRPVTVPTGGTAGPTATDKPQLQMTVKHVKPVFGTDFDVVVEVRSAQITIQ